MSYSTPPGGPGNAGPYGAPVQQQGWYQPPPPPSPPPGNSSEGKGLKRVVIGLVVLAVVAVLGVGGLALYTAVGGGSLPGAQGGGDEEQQILSSDEIETLLNGRTTALKSGDEDEFLKPFVGAAKDKQRKIFRNLRKVPFAESKYMVLKQTGDGSDEWGSDVSLTLDVAFVHQIKGVDVRPVSEWYRWTVEKESESAEPRISEVGGSPGASGMANAVYYPAPWDLYDDMYVKRQARTITISAKKNSADADRFAPIVEASAEKDLDLWRSNMSSVPNTPEGFLVVLEPDRKTYIKLYNNNSYDVGWDAGQSVPMPAFNASYSGGNDQLQYGGARIKMDTSTSRFTSSTWQRGAGDISRHEIAHALIQPQDPGAYGQNEKTSIRAWVVEGFAEYVSYRFDRALGDASVRADLAGEEFSGELPGQDFELANSTVGANYSLSYLAMRFIAEKGGEEALFEFVVDHYRQPTNLDQQLQKAVGMNEREFETAWAQYVRSNI
ncbi:hypothetical protein [Streptomyces bluensis]|uniref:hypothetical protein n=1 Tax=Streptomyces bluensis TaxID=33897 RepID=UPI001679C892|nr:hypothetical protein [Streptomyces bluensis]GGZ67438.1 hypothetical protein GCM10010344_38090 [Streptomyces bluensis]